MKKILLLAGMMVCFTSVFALNAEVALKDKCPDYEEFEQVASQKNLSFVMQGILINFADPLATMLDGQAMPKAVCYAQYTVRGKSLVEFVRAHADIFPEDKTKRTEEQNLLAFAKRVEDLSYLSEVLSQENDYFIAQSILINMADPFAQLPNGPQAVKQAKNIASLQVKGQPLVQFVSKMASQFPDKEEQELRTFASRVTQLAK